MINFIRNKWIRNRIGRTGAYLELSNHQCYYESFGKGAPLLMLHGGMSTPSTFRYQIPYFSKYYQVLLPERPGHGHTADVEGPYSYEQMAEVTIEFMDKKGIEKAHMIGHSDGANLMYFIGLKYPDRMNKSILIGGNFHHKGCTEEHQEEMRQLPDDYVGEEIDERYLNYSPDKPEHYWKVFTKVRKLWLQEPTLTKEDLSKISNRFLIISGDKDMIELEHTLEMYESLPKSELCVLSHTSHSIHKEKPNIVNREIHEFFQRDHDLEEQQALEENPQ